jgi:hypothetical protein
MVEAAILFKLLPVSIIDIYKVFENIDMLSIGIWAAAVFRFSYTLPTTNRGGTD